MGEIDGASERDRTSDLLITNQPLYRLSYAGPKEQDYSRDMGRCPAEGGLDLELLLPPLSIAGIEDLGAGFGRHAQDLQAEGPRAALVPAPDDLGLGRDRVCFFGRGAQELDLRAGDEIEVQIKDELQSASREIFDPGFLGQAALLSDLDNLGGEHALESQVFALIVLHKGIIRGQGTEKQEGSNQSFPVIARSLRRSNLR